MKRKIRKFRGGGMDASKSDFKSPDVNKNIDKGNNKKEIILNIIFLPYQMFKNDLFKNL